jgi:cytochrome c-type biogenesis protein CcsB
VGTLATAFALVSTLLVPGLADASVAGLEELKQLPVQAGGRVKPLDTYAREFILEVYGKDSWEGHDATGVAMSMMADGDAWRQRPMIRVEHLELKDTYSLERARKYFSFEELVDQREFIAWVEDLRKSGRDDFSKLEKAGLEVYNRLVLVDLAAQKMQPNVVPSLNDEMGEWMSIGQLEGMSGAPFVAGLLTQWNALRDAALAGDDAAVSAALADWKATVSQNAGWALVHPTKIAWEARYNAVDPFHRAWMIYMISFVLFLTGWIAGNRWLGFAGNLVLWAGFVLHTAGLLARQLIAGRPPISNLYESLTFIVWGFVFFAILYEMIKRTRIHGTIAAVLGTIGLVLANYLPIERELNPLVAVLRSYWLQYHVTTILLSYSALTLAAGLAHFHLFTEWFAPHRKDLARKASSLLATMMKVGVTFLATGIILGAVWASDSWGRYWGWDPKETWSLITLMGYVAILHGRFAGWLTPYGVSVANVACWGLVLFTYYGVNYFLVGLHSYAGKGPDSFSLPPALIAYLIVEAAVVAAGVWYEKSGRLRARRSAA